MRGAWMIIPSPRYIATWWMELGLLVVAPEHQVARAQLAHAMIGVDAAYCATE